MARELSDDAVRFQAEAFLDWALKSGPPTPGAFNEWARSKDFGAADLLAIVRALRATGRYV